MKLTGTDRLEAFSDGVFAIAITLLVLEIKVPPATTPLGLGLLNLWPSYVAYGVSFLVIGAIWINHHSMFEHVARVDEGLLLINILHLMFTAFLPFPTAVLAEALHRHSGESVAAAFYGGTLTVLGLVVNALWFRARRVPHLLDERITRELARRLGRRYIVGPLVYVLATTLAFISPWISLSIFAFANLYYLWPRRARAHHSGSEKENT